MKKNTIKQYAKLIAKTGVNVQKNQEVLISAEVNQYEFVEILVKECYKLGAAKVIIDWRNQNLTALNVDYQSEETLSSVLAWELERLEHRVETLPALIHILSEDPDGLSDIDQLKYANAMQKRSSIVKPYRDRMENLQQWCIAAVPSEAWAKKVFPKLSTKKAVEKLWEAILSCSRADGKDPIKAWKEHNSSLDKRCAYLNSLEIETLEYKSSNGTNFTVGLMPESRFCAGSEKTLQRKVQFNPNIPSEEIFTTPDKNTAEGIVFSSLPLSYRGVLIENFTISFHNGKVTKVTAEKNQEALETLVKMDEGSSMLGECALVAYDSPIRNSGILFYNTLFDENASCHLALGMGFSNCIDGFEKLSLEDCKKLGMNDSIVHEDFMIGTKDLSVVAVSKDGLRTQIFKDGNWVL